MVLHLRLPMKQKAHLFSLFTSAAALWTNFHSALTVFVVPFNYLQLAIQNPAIDTLRYLIFSSNCSSISYPFTIIKCLKSNTHSGQIKFIVYILHCVHALLSYNAHNLHHTHALLSYNTHSLSHKVVHA